MLVEPAEGSASTGRAPNSSRILSNETIFPSFPSGHAMLSAVTYLTLGALAARFLGGPDE